MCVKDVVVQNQVGLHARPATFFTQKANGYKSSIWVEKEDRRVNARACSAFCRSALWAERPFASSPTVPTKKPPWRGLAAWWSPAFRNDCLKTQRAAKRLRVFSSEDNMEIFDSHAHYNDAAFAADRDAVLSALPEKGVVGVVNAADSLESIPACLDLAARYPFVYAAVGVHP